MSVNPRRFTPKPNDIGNFYPADQHWAQKEVTIAASTAMEAGAILVPTSGTWDLATSATTSMSEAVILQSPVASTDSDYATSGKTRLCWYPLNANAEMYFTVGTGTLTTSYLGEIVDLDDSVSVDIDTSTNDHVVITEFISASRGKCRFYDYF